MTRNTGTLFLAGALIGLSSVAFSNTDFATAAASAFTSSTYRALDLFHAVFSGVRSDYVEKPDERALIDGAIKGMLGSLDPYSSYLAPNDLKAKQAEIAGEVGSLGLEVTMADGVIKVISPIDDTPASHAGMLTNDLIIKIDGDDVEGITLDEAVEKLGGAVQSSTTLTVMRKGNDKPFDVTLVREEMPVQSVKSREDGQVGYIRISQFNEKTAEGLKSAIDKIQAEIGKDRVQGYVLDLRNNPAGLIDQAVAISSDFLDGGEIVEIRGRQPDQARRFSATGGDLVAGKPVNRPGQRRLGLGLGDCRRCIAGSSTGDDCWHKIVWQRHCPNHHPAWRQGCITTDNWPLLYPFRAVDSDRRHRPGHSNN